VSHLVIRDETLRVLDGHVDKPDLVITADTQVWLRFLRKEISIVRALLTRKIKLRGSPKLLLAFGRCFPCRNQPRSVRLVAALESLVFAP
jgi:hypothetical protein